MRLVPTQPTAIILSSFLVLAIAAPALAADDEAYIKYRQKVMTSVGANMGAIGDILKNGLPNMESIKIHAGLLEDSADLIGPAFKHRVAEGATDAMPEIWDDWTKFEQAIADFKQAAADLESVADGTMADIGPKMKALGQACGGCHKPFRKPKEESYKN